MEQVKANSLGLINTNLYRLYRLIKKKSNHPDSKIKLSNENNKIEIKVLEYCDDPKIANLFRDLEVYSEYISVFLHGSYADRTTTEFSDIDDFIIIDLKKVRERKLENDIFRILNKIDMKFCSIDPLQHHGHWITSKDELNDYDNSFIPLFIIKSSKIVLAKNNIINARISLKKTKKGLVKNLNLTCENILLLFCKLKENRINAYELKSLIGSFALIPALLFQLKGYKYSKSKSINLSSKIFSIQAFFCIQWATQNRKNWFEITNSFRFKIFSMLTYFFRNPYLWRMFSQNFSPRVTKIQIKQLCSFELTDEMVYEFIDEVKNNLNV